MSTRNPANMERPDDRFRLVRGVLACLIGAALHGASVDPSTLLQQKKFREAQTAFEAMAARQPDDPRWRYNAGVAAFRAGDPTTAQKHFESATAASDLGLQQRAWYNLGNAWFEKATAPESEEQEEALKKAAEAFGAALQLTPTDRPAKENLEAVKKFEELLKQQQQQQDQQKDGQQDPKNSKDQKDQPGKQGKNGKQNSGNDPNNKSDSEQANHEADEKSKQDQASKSKETEESKKSGDTGKGDQEDKKDGSKNDLAKQATNNPAGGSKTNQQSQAKAGGDKSGIQRGEGSEPAGAEGDAAQLAREGERMTVVQAQQMLDAQKGSEKPIWTLVRGWGQENQQAPSSSTKRRTW